MQPVRHVAKECGAKSGRGRGRSRTAKEQDSLGYCSPHQARGSRPDKPVDSQFKAVMHIRRQRQARLTSSNLLVDLFPRGLPGLRTLQKGGLRTVPQGKAQRSHLLMYLWTRRKTVRVLALSEDNMIRLCQSSLKEGSSWPNPACFVCSSHLRTTHQSLRGSSSS